LKIIDFGARILRAFWIEANLEPKAREKLRKRMPFVDAFLPTLSECKAVMA